MLSGAAAVLCSFFKFPEIVIKIIFAVPLTPYLCAVKNIILLLTAFIMLTKPLWPVVDYVIHYDYIVNMLCENKDNPEMHCNGKCHLSKELAKEAGDDNKNPFTGKTSKTEIPQVIISENISEFLFKSEPEIITCEKVGYRPILHASLFISRILHPPRLG